MSSKGRMSMITIKETEEDAMSMTSRMRLWKSESDDSILERLSKGSMDWKSFVW